ncbi:hypothetical protein L596_005023 [Steinernema carpocapsae]|uniref:Ground-like domain-containing protein n=1 Tax=Steinernema carpocapsae TaxID=34508 RepID=A0A4U8V1W3_STECR|nr:hypothetical protein L596_005023 [Steinernema carpocapsae]
MKFGNFSKAICPPPPPPPPPAMCPPMPPPMACPMPVASPCGGYAPAPVYQPAYVMPPSNDCCCQCNRPCHYRARARSHGARIFSAPVAEVEEDPTCNSQKLRALMEDNITRDPSISKRAIQKAVEEKLFGKYNVICAKGDFSYVAYTETYCQTSNDDVTCYAFRPL